MDSTPYRPPGITPYIRILISMDKKSIILGVLFLAAGFILLSYNSMQMQQRDEREPRTPPREESQEPGVEKPASIAEESSPEESSIVKGTEDIDSIVRETQSKPDSETEEKPVILENEFLKVTLTNRGGAIKNISLKKQPAKNPHTTENPGPMVLNTVSDIPALSLTRKSNAGLLPVSREYQLESQSRREAIYTAEIAGGLRIRRTYTISDDPTGPESYTIHHRTEFINESNQVLNLESVYFNIGTAAPTEADYMGFNLNASYYQDGDYDSIPASKFKKGGFLFFQSGPKEQVIEQGPLAWGAVKNQFFASIITPENPAESIFAEPVKFPPDPRTGEVPVGITASLEFSLSSLQPQGMEALNMAYYAGPKDYKRLSQMGKNQEDVLQLGWFLGFFLGIIGFVGKTLLSLMSGIHGVIGNWGFAIIFTTFVIRLLLWPLTAKAARSSKRMQELQKPLQAIREKYADNPQKLNEEMMKLWKKHKINPLSGCWPILIQFPIFISFFNLLRNSADLRFAEFLWINDLSMPDATLTFGEAYLPLIGNTLNVLPFFWLVSMYFQMKMMPQPSIDNAQVKIMRFMPFIFFPFTYFFSSGLVLYWTTTNCFSIFQQYITNRKKDDEDIAIEKEIEESENPKKIPSGPLISKKKKKKKSNEGGLGSTRGKK